MWPGHSPGAIPFLPSQAGVRLGLLAVASEVVCVGLSRDCQRCQGLKVQMADFKVVPGEMQQQDGTLGCFSRRKTRSLRPYMQLISAVAKTLLSLNERSGVEGNGMVLTARGEDGTQHGAQCSKQ